MVVVMAERLVVLSVVAMVHLLVVELAALWVDLMAGT